MLKKLGISLAALIVVILVFAFAANNPGSLQLDLFLTRVDTSISVALAVTFAAGFLFGVLCMSAFIIRLINDRRQLRRALRRSESEVTSLRNLPLADAD